MELEAVIQGLKLATGRHPPFDPSRYRKIVVKTDATYVTENFGRVASVWRRNGWRTKTGKPVDNAKQWKELVRLVGLARKGQLVTIKWVPGKRSPTTKAVDKLARGSAMQPSHRQFTRARWLCDGRPRRQAWPNRQARAWDKILAGRALGLNKRKIGRIRSAPDRIRTCDLRFRRSNVV